MHSSYHAKKLKDEKKTKVALIACLGGSFGLKIHGEIFLKLCF
jgi:hypothetical protein